MPPSTVAVAAPPATIKTGNLYRSLAIAKRAEDATAAEDRTIELAWASETPVQRWFGIEVLDCTPGSVRLDRLNNGGALLVNHDIDQQVGVCVPGSVRVDPDRICRAPVRFSRQEDAEAVYQDVLDGIRTLVSVSYEIHKYVEEKTINPDGSETTICRVTDWEPLELSLVAVPADPKCGVGRAAGAEEHDTIVIRSADTTPPATAPKTAIKDRPTMDPHTPATPDTTILQAEQKRTADLLALADTYAQFGARDMVADAIRTGKSTETFLNAVMGKITERHSSAQAIEIGLAGKDLQNYSIMRAVQASLLGDWSKAGLERSVSEAVAKRTGYTPDGFFVPVEAFSRAFSVGTAAEAGNLVGTQLLGNEFIDVLRNSMVLSKLGVRVLGGLTSNIAIPRKTAGTTVASYSEIGTITASNPSTTQITLSPKRIGAQVLYSKQALIQGNPDVGMMLQDDLAQGCAVQIENLGINGTAASNQPRGLFNFNGVGSVVGGTDGATITWAHLVNLESACANANAEPDARAGYLINTKARGWCKQTVKGTYLPFIWDNGDTPLNSYRAAVTNNVPSNGSKGASSGILSSLAFSSDWQDMILALFGGLDITVDPYTQAGTGQVVLTANQYLEIACRQPASFAVMTDAKTA